MDTKVYVLIKDICVDYDHSIILVAVSENYDKIQDEYSKCLAAEKEEQKEFGLEFDTEEESDKCYYAYNEGYAAENSCLIQIFEKELI